MIWWQIQTSQAEMALPFLSVFLEYFYPEIDKNA
jgi:hypothetical protein